MPCWARAVLHLSWLLILGLPGLGSAHKASDSYLTLRVGEGALTARWAIALRDLEYAIGLDQNGDGEITWGELKQSHERIAEYALGHLSLRGDDRDCALEVRRQQVDRYSDGAYSVLELGADCAASRSVAIRYGLFFDLDAQHRGIVQLQEAETTQAGILGPGARTRRFELGGTPPARRLAQALEFGAEGVWHIWAGIDHILFLVALLLPAALQRSAGRWLPRATLREVLLDVTGVVTCFTIAHTLTLSSVTLGVVSLPSRWVEATIAFSVVLAALNNLFPLFHGWRWVIALGFGLIHGFGFASVLADLGLPQSALWVALLAFNLGVELGQMIIVAAIVPLLFALRGTRGYPRFGLQLGSAITAIIALLWTIERALDLKLS